MKIIVKIIIVKIILTKIILVFIIFKKVYWEVVMKKRVTFTVDEDLYESIQKIPRGVSLSARINWLLKALISVIKGMSDEEFRKIMDSDPEGKLAHKYFKEKYGPVLDEVENKIEAAKKSLKKKK